MSATEATRAASLLVREQFCGLSEDEFVRLRDAVLAAEYDRGLVDPQSTRYALDTEPLDSAERERRTARTWHRSAVLLNSNANFWRKRCEELEAGKDPGPLVPAAPKARINSHGYIVLNAVGHERPFLWVRRNFVSCGNVHDGIGITNASDVEDDRPYQGSWVVSWAELRAAVIEIDRSLKESGEAHLDGDSLEERFQSMFGTWASTPAGKGDSA